MPLKHVTTPHLTLAYHEYGARTGWPVVLSHGFPYGPEAFDEVVPVLVEAGAWVFVPYLRGFGTTRLREGVQLTGQQAALGHDLIDLLDALDIEAALLAGFDWGGVASCTASVLAPDRVTGLVSMAGYDIIDVAGQSAPAVPSLEHVMWYQHLFQSERGKQCLKANRKDLCLLLWRQWSPNWSFSQELFDKVSAHFDSDDFVNIVIHAYRFCFGSEKGLDEYKDSEEILASRPGITVPCITIDGTDDSLKPGGTASHRDKFLCRYEHRAVMSGHAIPFEAPAAFSDCILTVHQWATESRVTNSRNLA